jgi:hypothetical protein
VIAVLSCNLFKPNSSENNKEQLINISEMYHLEINPCENNGTCSVDVNGNATCTCDGNWSGTYCQGN